MALLVSKVDKVFESPSNKHGIKEAMRFELKAGVPLEVPDVIAKEKVKSYPNIYKIVESGEKIEAPETPVVKDPPADDFNAVEFLSNSYPVPPDFKEQLEAKDQKQLFEICRILKLQLPANIGKAKQIERIIADIEVKNSSVNASDKE